MNPWVNFLFYVFYTVILLGMLIPTVMTVLPGEASKPNRLGYFSRCSFAPLSTISLVGITLFLLGIVYGIQMAIGN